MRLCSIRKHYAQTSAIRTRRAVVTEAESPLSFEVAATSDAEAAEPVGLAAPAEEVPGADGDGSAGRRIAAVWRSK